MEGTIGGGTEPTSQVGPLIDGGARDDVHALVTAAVDAGASVITGGAPVSGPGYFYQPTVLGNVSNDATILGQEIFGPVAPVTIFITEEDAIRLANASEYVVASYLYSVTSPGSCEWRSRSSLAWPGSTLVLSPTPKIASVQQRTGNQDRRNGPRAWHPSHPGSRRRPDPQLREWRSSSWRTLTRFLAGMTSPGFPLRSSSIPT